MLMVTIVRAIAITGEISAIVFDRSARFSSTNCMSRVFPFQGASAHQQAERLAIGIAGRKRFREAAVEHHCNTVCDLDEFIQVLAGHQYGGPPLRDDKQGLARYSRR